MKINPCPFCRSKKTVQTSHGEFVTVNCLKCFACGPQSETTEEAIKLWNKRERKEKTMKQLKTKAFSLAQMKSKLVGTDENGYGKCIYCGLIKSWAELNGCHWIPKGRGAATEVSVDPHNIHPGCQMCNNLNDSRKYTLNMQTMYPKHVLDELEKRSKMILTRAELEEFITVTRAECRELAKNKIFKVNIP